MENPAIFPKQQTLGEILTDYALLSKFRLTMLVVFSASLAFLAAPVEMDFFKLFILIVGGFLTTASANGFNQVIERDLDKLMDRTRQRPLPDGRMTTRQAFFFSLLTGLIGTGLLFWFLNPLSGFLGMISILLYTLVYTPMKKRSPVAVFIGAVPGAIPPLLGWVAATGTPGMGGWLLFSIQFLWQFPHFWAIAWVLDDDYRKAGFIMLPSGKRDRDSAFQTLIYTVSLLPLAFMPYVFGISGVVAVVTGVGATAFFIWQARQMFISCDMASARKLMFGSFVYLPLVQLAIALDKI